VEKNIEYEYRGYNVQVAHTGGYQQRWLYMEPASSSEYYDQKQLNCQVKLPKMYTIIGLHHEILGRKHFNSCCFAIGFLNLKGYIYDRLSYNKV